MDGVSGPTRLVYHDEKGVLRMDEEAVSILQDVKGPIGVVSICGPVQHGKSYISNQLLGKTSGFKVAPCFLPDCCTKGLWMWIDPKKETAADGTEYSILVIDTEGIDIFPHTVDYFYLAVVLSSMLVYNQLGRVGGSFFEFLSVVTEISDLLDTTTTRKFSPIFVSLFRDFFTPFVNQTPTQYLESSLKLFNAPKNTAAYRVDKVKRSIKTVFPRRHCFVLVRPFFLLCGRATVDGMVGEEFKNGMDKFRSFVRNKSKPKKMGKKVVTGPILVKIIQYMLEAFSSGKRPMLASILENVTLNSFEPATTVADTPAVNTRLRKRNKSC